MKKNYLYFVAVFFVFAVALALTGAHFFERRSAVPSFAETKLERVIGKKLPPAPYFAP